MKKVEIEKGEHGWILSVCYDEYLEIPIENQEEMREIAKVLLEKADEIEENEQHQETLDEWNDIRQM